MSVRSTERKVSARITVAPPPDVRIAMSLARYSATSVDPNQKIVMTDVSPFRRWFFNEASQEPDVFPAKVGDDCEIAVCQGHNRLCAVPEQFIVGDCPPDGTPGTVPTIR